MLPLAAVEQHGPHLPLGVDSFIADAYLSKCGRIAARSFRHVFSDAARQHFHRTPGLFGNTQPRPDAVAAWTELGESVARAGLRKLVLVTSHGGNVAAMELVARDLRARRRHAGGDGRLAPLRLPGWRFSARKKTAFTAATSRTSLMLAAMPNTVRMDKAARATPETIAMAQEFDGSALIGAASPG